MADDRVALVSRQHEYALELGQRPDARPRLPAPIVPLGDVDLGVIALAESARDRPDGEALQAHHDRVETRRLRQGGRRRCNSVDGGLGCDEESGCRLRATGWLFSLDLKRLHGMFVPSELATDRFAPAADSRSSKKRESFQLPVP